jgi:transposase
MTEETKKKCGRRYDRDFKSDAVALIRRGNTMAEVARDLGVSAWTITRWIRDEKAAQGLTEPGTLAAESAEQREMRRLRQQNDSLRRQREILKKALSILSAEMPPSDTP